MPPSGTHRISRRVEGRRHHHGRPDLLGEEAVAADLDLRRDGAGDVGVVAAGVVGVADGRDRRRRPPPASHLPHASMPTEEMVCCYRRGLGRAAAGGCHACGEGHATAGGGRA